MFTYFCWLFINAFPLCRRGHKRITSALEVRISSGFCFSGTELEANISLGLSVYNTVCDAVRYMCVHIIAAITLFIHHNPQLFFTFMVIMPSNLATVHQVLDNNTIQLLTQAAEMWLFLP